jgi:hypothetical protein
MENGRKYKTGIETKREEARKNVVERKKRKEVTKEGNRN